MAFTPFVASDLPTMANFNGKFEEAIAAAVSDAESKDVKIATGSYTGTGTYGNTTAGNENTLTFSFEPKVVFVVGVSANATLWMANGAKYAAAIISNNIYAISISWSGNSVTWYNSSRAEYQLNGSGAEYNYIAIG